MSEEICEFCGTPSGRERRGSVRMTCDDICLGAWLDRQPGGHFANWASGPLCGENGVLCDLHCRLADKTFLAQLDDTDLTQLDGLLAGVHT